ncbi:MAG TPA: hypothetical protein DDX19_19005 [Rhodopirellula baltica]|nr:hypothetical protein [Rhodopirellula baltica]
MNPKVGHHAHISIVLIRAPVHGGTSRVVETQRFANISLWHPECVELLPTKGKFNEKDLAHD